MDIQYDQLNAKYAELNAMEAAKDADIITDEEYEAQEAIIKNEIRVILGFGPLPPE